MCSFTNLVWAPGPRKLNVRQWLVVGAMAIAGSPCQRAQRAQVVIGGGMFDSWRRLYIAHNTEKEFVQHAQRSKHGILLKDSTQKVVSGQ